MKGLPPSTHPPFSTHHHPPVGLCLQPCWPVGAQPLQLSDLFRVAGLDFLSDSSFYICQLDASWQLHLTQALCFASSGPPHKVHLGRSLRWQFWVLGCHSLSLCILMDIHVFGACPARQMHESKPPLWRRQKAASLCGGSLYANPSVDFGPCPGPCP